MKIWRFIAAIAFAICGTTAFAATTSVQFGADRTVAPWNICVYDSTNTCRTFMTLPSTGGGALIPPAYGGTGVNNGTNTLTLGGVLATTGTGATTLAFPNSAATFTYPTSSDTLVGLAATQILSNKSFASSFNVNGATSGSVNIAAQAIAGIVSLTLPSASGTVAASAASPIVLSATTGQISCPSCLTGAGGALTATAPLNLSGSNVLSLQGGNGTLAQGSAGTGSTFTATPTLGVAGSTLGSVAFANTTSGTVTLQPTSGALGSSILSLPAITDTLVTLTATQTLSNKTLASPAHTGTSTFAGSSTGTVSLAAQASAGTPSIVFPTGSGTLADSAASPITLSSTTGQIACATCVTSSGGGAITGTAPINVSAAGAVSLQGGNGTIAQGSGGTGSSFTATPTLGVAGTTVGTLAFDNATSGSVTLQPTTGALGSSVLTLPAVTDTLVGIAATQTLTNKTISGGTISGGTLSGTIAGTPTLSGSNFIANSNLVQGGAATLKGNPTASLANVQDFTIQGLTADTSPDMTNDLLPIYNHTTGTLQNVNAHQLFNSVTTGVTSLTNTDGTLNISPSTGAVVASLNPAAQRSYLGGLTLSNDGTSPNSVLDIAAGTANDSTNAAVIQIGTFTKSTAGAWASGSGSNGMGNGLTVAASTWYHVCLAYNGGTPDVWFDTSVICANKPTGVSGSLYRRIGSFKTDASSHILAFTQVGDEFHWSVATNDYSTTTLGTTAVLQALNVPPGIVVNALINVGGAGSTAAGLLISSPDQTDEPAGTPSGNNSIFLNTSFAIYGAFNIRTNTSQQIRFRSGAASTTVNEATYGWVDTRGRFN